MTKKEITGIRDIKFSRWIRSNLPDSKTGFLVSDLDFIIYNSKTYRLMLIEVKINNSGLKEWQKDLFRKIDAMLHRNASDQGIWYLGFHVITFTGAECDWKTGECYFDKTRVNEDELRELLSI